MWHKSDDIDEFNSLRKVELFNRLKFSRVHPNPNRSDCLKAHQLLDADMQLGCCSVLRPTAIVLMAPLVTTGGSFLLI